MDSIKQFEFKLVKSQQYKIWLKDHNDSYLCSVFLIGNNFESNNWQLDYYNPKTDTINSFVEINGEISVKEETIFKKPEEEVKKLDLSLVKVSLKQALEKFEQVKSDKYPTEIATQKIIILQNLREILWNITYISSSFNILNIKINAVNGSIISDNLSSVLSFKDKKFDKSSFDSLL